MKIRSMLFVLCFGLCSIVMASPSVHTHPKADSVNQKATAQALTYPGSCDIEIINDSYTDLQVLVTFDDGARTSFHMYPRDIPQYVDLYYYGRCHSSAYITIQSPYDTAYSGWTSVGTTLRIGPYLNHSFKVKSSTR